MDKQRIYIDTSVIGGYFDKELSKWSVLLFNEFFAGLKIAVVSETTLEELSSAPEQVKSLFKEIPEESLELITNTEEIINLANEYILSGILTEKSKEDAIHIASATISTVDVIASWNFKHIVNLDKIKKYNLVNKLKGYSLIEIRNPMEVLNYE
jgi:hypothetical protein